MADEKSQSWVYEGPTAVVTNGKYSLKYPDERENDGNIEMNERTHGRASEDDEAVKDWTEAKEVGAYKFFIDDLCISPIFCKKKMTSQNPSHFLYKALL